MNFEKRGKMEYAFSYRRTQLILIISLLIGVICGTFLFNCLNAESKNSLLIYYKYMTGKIDFADVNKCDYFIYVFSYRLREILFLIILGLTSYKIFFHSVFMWYFGIKNSILISVLTIVKGKMSLIWYLALTQPQMMIYLFIVYKIISKMDFGETNSKKTSCLKELLRVILGVIFVCFLECMLNIHILSNFV